MELMMLHQYFYIFTDVKTVHSFDKISFWYADNVYDLKLAVVSTCILLDALTGIVPQSAYTHARNRNVLTRKHNNHAIALTSLSTWNCTDCRVNSCVFLCPKYVFIQDDDYLEYTACCEAVLKKSNIAVVKMQHWCGLNVGKKLGKLNLILQKHWSIMYKVHALLEWYAPNVCEVYDFSSMTLSSKWVY